MSSIDARLRRLEGIDQQTPSPDDPPEVEVWLPDNGRSSCGRGRHRCPGTRTDLIIYDPDGTGEQPPPYDKTPEVEAMLAEIRAATAH